jgi:two-component system sensor histidine kinase CpxA
MRSLFSRVFVVFWLSSALMLISLAVITALTDARPLSHRWLIRSFDLYASTAIDLYEQGGKGRLNEYLSAIKNDSQISAALLVDGVNAGTTQIPSGTNNLLSEARVGKRSVFSFSSPWIGVLYKVRGTNVYIFIAEVSPVRMYGNFLNSSGRIFRLTVLLIISATLCFLLARSITEPIRSLQKTAQQIARGDLGARASPALSGRKDELALLAHDFDLMAERIQVLLDQQNLLLRDISHELRSPLARLSVSAELVQRGDIGSAARMQADITALEKMISDLLTLARIDASESHSRREQVHIGRLVQRIVTDASFEGLPEKKTVVQTGVFDRYALADMGLIHSCIENVVRNALQHSPAGGVVEVKLSDSGKAAHGFLDIITTDEGDGVPEEVLSQIFEPFFRVSTSESHKRGGGGLGLSISKRIADLYGGTISARNLAGHGLQVQIQLPVAADSKNL